MHDQAEALRQLIERHRKKTTRKTKVVAVASGKGGVGKSNFILNFSIQLQKLDKKIVILDADFGMANLDILVGHSPKYQLLHIIEEQKTLWDVLHVIQRDVELLAGGPGLKEMFKKDNQSLQRIIDQLSLLDGDVDYILIDTGAGLTAEAERFLYACDDIIIVTTPEPTSMTDAYALMKWIVHGKPSATFRLVVNRVENDREGDETAKKFQAVAMKFLSVHMDTLGWINEDSKIVQAVKRQVPFVKQYPTSIAARQLMIMADRYCSDPLDRGMEEHTTNSVQRFFQKLLRRS